MLSDRSSSEFIESDISEITSDFTDLEEIKSSGFNRIFKAKRYGKWFILKGLKPEYVHEQLYLELLKKEFDISVSMDHPGIVRTIGLENVGKVEDVKNVEEVENVKNVENVGNIGPCIVFEYIEGRTLKRYLSERHSRKERERIADAVIDAVSFIHKKQIAHRDLKPENIIVTNNGDNVKIIDFGLADTDAHAILKQPAGTEKYISPEQRTATDADCRNDIYSIGKILLDINAGLVYSRAAKRCLRDIEHRYQNASDLKHAIALNKQIVKIAIYLAVFIVAVFIIKFYTSSYKTERAIEAGKQRIDEITLPMKNFVDTVSVFDKASYEQSQQIYYARSTALDRIIDSLTENMDDNDRIVVKTALNDYYIETTPKF